MLLTCKSCGNTYVIDDAEWARPDGDGKICEQCQEPLVPLIAGGAQQDSTTILEGYSFDGLQSSWRGQSGGAVGAAMPEPQHAGGAWEEPGGGMPPGGWGGSMSASVPLPPDMGSMAKPPPTGGYGPPPGMPAGYGAPPGAYGAGGGYPGAPPPTQALDPVGAPSPDDPNAVYIGSNERTMALDLDNLRGNAGPGGAPVPTQALDPIGPAGGGARGDSAQHTGQLDTSSLQRGRGKKQVIIGGASRAPAHEDRTAAIDLSQASAYAAKMQGAPMPPQQQGFPPGMAQPGMAQPGMAQPQRPRPIPGMMPPQPQPMPQSGGGALKTVLILFFVLLLLGGGAAAVYFLVLDGGGKRSSSGGGGGGGSEAAAFTDRLAASQAASSGMLLPSISGEIPEDGQILLVSAAEGLFVESSLLVPYSGGAPTADALDKGLFMPALATALGEADPTLPIIVLLDTTLQVQAAFPVLYTAMASGRRVLVGGSTVENPSSVGVLELNPWQWPAPPSGEFTTPTKQTDLRVMIGTGAVKVAGKQVNDTGEGDPNQLTLDMLALTRLPSALASAKGANSDLDAVRFVPAPDLTVGKFIEIVQIVRGDDYNYPRFGTLYLEAPAKP